MTSKKFVLAACTRRRPEMLEHLLTSWTKLAIPADLDLRFLVVENDAQESCADLVAKILGDSGTYVLEPNPGIPMARNSALDAARAMQADYLAFVDDDEECPDDWLVNIWPVAQAHDLTGGPLRIVAAQNTLGYWNKAALKLHQTRAETLARRRANADPQKLDLYTNNWVLALAATDLRFDEALQFSGGSDTRFSDMATQQGLKKGWAPDAYIIDRWPNRRLTARYFFERASAQTAQNNVRSARRVKSPLIKLPGLLLLAALLPVLFLVQGPQVVMRFARNAGVAHGLWMARRGQGHRHYAPEAEKFHTKS